MHSDRMNICPFLTFFNKIINIIDIVIVVIEHGWRNPVKKMVTFPMYQNKINQIAINIEIYYII